MLRKSIFSLSTLLVGAALVLPLWNCNVSGQGEEEVAIRLKLPDSLAADAGRYDSVVIAVTDAEGNPVGKPLFAKPYVKSTDSLRLNRLPIDFEIPDPMKVRISAFKDNVLLWVMDIDVANGKATHQPPRNVLPLDSPVAAKGVRLAFPTPLVLYVGDGPKALGASVVPAEAAQAITWTLSSTGAASLEGNAIRPLQEGVATLKASSTSAADVFAEAEVIVKPAPTKDPSSIVINSPSPLSLTAGGAGMLLQATIEPPDANQAVTWSAAAGGYVEIVDENQVRGLKAGTTSVVARSVSKPDISTSLQVVVAEAPAVLPKSIRLLTGSPVVIAENGPTAPLSAAVDPPEADQGVVWTMEASGIAEIVNRNQVRGLRAGLARVVATSVVSSSITGFIDVKVEAAAVKPLSVSLMMAVPIHLAVTDAPASLVAKVLPAGAPQGLTWKSSDTNVVRITTDSKAKAIKPGTSTLTALSTADTTVQSSFDVVVSLPVKVDGISISPRTLPLFTGGHDGKVEVALAGNDTNARYNLASSNPTVATVAADGTVKPWKEGKVLVTATVVGHPALVATCTVNVTTDPPVPSITPDQTIAYGGEAVFDVSVTQAFGSVSEIKADMDGNGIYEQSVLNKSVAQFRSSYSEVKTYNLRFEIRDSEGNVVEVLRKVKVNPPGAPVVTIIDPASTITINSASYTIRFTVKDPTAPDIAKDSLVTLTDGSNIIRISRTNAGGTSSDEVEIIVDRTAPAVPVFVARASPFTNNRRPTWSWAPIAGATKYQVRMGNAEFTSAGTVELTGTTYSPTADLVSDGDYTLHLRALDPLGNPSSPVSQTVTLDTQKPGAVRFLGTNNSYVATATPTWEWEPASATGASSTFVLQLNGQPAFDFTGTRYTPPAELGNNAAHTLRVSQRDRVEGVIGDAASFTFNVKTQKANAPSVRSADPAYGTKNVTNNLKFQWTSGGGGNGLFQVRLNGQSVAQTPGQPGPEATEWTLPGNSTNGNYTLYVSEQDATGRWSDEGQFTLQLDRTAPVLSDIRLKDEDFALRDGFITNRPSIVISYKADNVSREATCNLVNQGSKVCEIIATDPAGNSASEYRTVWSRQNVIFLRNGGTGDGSSWERPLGNLADAAADAANRGDSIWVASDPSTVYPPLTISQDISILTGFNAASYPVDPKSRTKWTNRIQALSAKSALTAHVEGFVITGVPGTGENMAFFMQATVTLVDCKFEDGDPSIASNTALSMAYDAKVTLRNVWITNQQFQGNVIYPYDGDRLIIDGGTITGNNSWNPAIDLANDLQATFMGALRISGNSNNNEETTGVQVRVQDAAKLTIHGSVDLNTNFIQGAFTQVP